MRSRLSHILAPLLLALGACATPADEPTPVVAEVAPPPPEPVVETPESEPVPEPVVEPEPTPAPEPAFQPSDLIGLEPAAVQNILGPVSLKRWEGDAQVMQYQNGHCVLDIYFYESAPGEAFEASYVSSRTSSGTTVMNDLCLASLLPGGVWVGEPSDPNVSGR